MGFQCMYADSFVPRRGLCLSLLRNHYVLLHVAFLESKLAMYMCTGCRGNIQSQKFGFESGVHLFKALRVTVMASQADLHLSSRYKRVKGRSHTVEKRKAIHPQKPHATSQPSRFSHTPRLSTDPAHN